MNWSPLAHLILRVVRFNPRRFGAPPCPAILPEAALNIDDYLPLGQRLRFALLIRLRASLFPFL
jgi:hypothetical protein